MYTPAIEHSACPLVGGICGDDIEHKRTSYVRHSSAGSDATYITGQHAVPSTTI